MLFRSGNSVADSAPDTLETQRNEIHLLPEHAFDWVVSAGVAHIVRAKVRVSEAIAFISRLNGLRESLHLP